MSILGNLDFTSDKNYLKRDVSTGSTDLAAPSTLSFGGLQYTTRYTIDHNLGYIPLFNTYYEPFKDGVIWPQGLSTRLVGSAENPTGGSPAFGPYLIAWATTTQLIIELGYVTNALTGTFPVYWIIYRDYELA